MSLIVFEPLALQIECAAGETVFAAARRQNVPIPTACVGRGTCGLCRVKVLEGEAALSPLNSVEKRHLGNTYYITKLRLSCQAQLVGEDATVTLLIPDAAKNRARLPLSKG
jgi:ferredoxin